MSARPLPAIGTTWLRTDIANRGKGRTVTIETVHGEGGDAVISYRDPNGRRAKSPAKSFWQPARFVPTDARAVEAVAPNADPLDTIIARATEAAGAAVEAGNFATASLALNVVVTAKSVKIAPRDDDPFAYDANGPRHTTARVPRGMTREAFEPLLIEWTATLDRDPA